MTVAIPDRMRKLPIDRRGYPVPWTVAHDAEGRPQFVVNDEGRRQACIKRDLCSICGGRLDRVRWFVGGPHSAFNERGAYIDPPMHHECAQYALQVCPYLALARTGRGYVDAQKVAQHMGEPLVAQTMLPGQPPLFVAVRASGTVVLSWVGPLVETIRPTRPYLRVEYWRHGQRLTTHQGEAVTREHLRRPLGTALPKAMVTP